MAEVKIDEKYIFENRTKLLLPDFKKMSYQERLSLSINDPKMYARLVELEREPPKHSESPPKFEKLIDVRTGEVRYIYKERKQL